MFTMQYVRQKWHNTVMSISFMKNKLKKKISFIKSIARERKIKMNRRGRGGNQDDKWVESWHISAWVSKGKQLFAEFVFSLCKLGQQSLMGGREDILLRHKIKMFIWASITPWSNVEFKDGLCARQAQLLVYTQPRNRSANHKTCFLTFLLGWF